LLFKGTHFFELKQEGEGTRLLHGEDSSGLIPMTFSAATMRDRFIPAYEAMNGALVERVALVQATKP